jgi:hypothetical protein
MTTLIDILGTSADLVVLGAAFVWIVSKLRDIGRNFSKAMQEGMRG